MTYHVEMLPFLFAAALRIMIAIYAWTRRDVPVARTFGWMMAAGALWTSVYILHLADPTLEGKLFWQKIMYLGAAFTPALWLIVAIQITGHKNWLTRPVRLAIFTWPIIVILSAFTNDWHHLFWTDYQLDDYKIEWNATHGPLFQVFQVPAFLLLLFNLILFTHHFFTCPRFYRPQAILLLIGGSLPVTSRIVQVVFGVELLDKVDQVPLWLSVSGILYVIAIFRYNTLDVLSVAQRLIAQNIKAGIVVIDHRHQVLGMNPYATGYWPHPSPIGEPLVHVIPECAGREMKDDDEWELVRTLEDREHILLAKVSEVSNHQVGNLGHALVFLDISDRKTAERVLREGLEAKGQFLANLSHELRTPLHGITGLLQLALSTNLSTQQKDYLTKADSSAQLLLLLINDVLDFSKLEAGKLEFERVSFELGTVVEQVRSAIGVNAAAKGIEFRINLEPFEHCVIGDPLRLSQVLMNLSSNAVKFTHAGYVELVIVVEHLSEKDATLRFSVTDTGIGIEQERIPKLFDLFAQAESSTTRRFGGTGLGLSISQQLVASMGGHIEVTSELGQGSCFFFSLQLPLSDEPPTRLAYDIARPDLSNFRFLVVDDSSINQQVAKELLQNAGANVETASNGHEALAALAKHHFDTVLMDVQMPELDGYETTKRIRENPALQSVPVIAMTANTRAEDKDRVIAAGMNDFVPKPFRDVELYATLSRWLKFEERENPAHVSSEASNTMGTAETLDFEAGLDRLQGNRALYFELLHALADELEGGMVALSDNAISDDAQKQIAHNLKGIAANLGANAVKDAADTLQSALPSKGLEPRSQSLQQLRNAIDRFHEHLAIIE